MTNAFFASGGRGPAPSYIGSIPPWQRPDNNFATLQNPEVMMAQAMAKSQARNNVETVQHNMEMEDNLAPMVISAGVSPQELVKMQLARGGDYVRSMMPGTPQTFLATPSGATRISYEGMQPLDEESLLSHPKFAALARTNPHAAARVYTAITGKDLGDTLATRRKLELSRDQGFTQGLQEQISRGTIRQNPETGLVERLVEQPDPNNPLQKTAQWVTAEAEYQQEATRYWENATGMKPARPNPLTSMGVPQNMQPALLALYRSNVADKKMAPKEAMEAAIKALPSPGSAPAQQAPTAQAGTPPPPPEAGDAAYQAWANAQAGETSAAIKAGYQKAMTPIAAAAIAPLQFMTGTSEANRVVGNIGTGLYNLPNQIASLVGAGPLYPWARPTSPAEWAKQMSEKLAPMPPGLTPEQKKAWLEKRWGTIPTRDDGTQSYAPVWPNEAL